MHTQTHPFTPISFSTLLSWEQIFTNPSTFNENHDPALHDRRAMRRNGRGGRGGGSGVEWPLKEPNHASHNGQWCVSRIASLYKSRFNAKPLFFNGASTSTKSVHLAAATHSSSQKAAIGSMLLCAPVIRKRIHASGQLQKLFARLLKKLRIKELEKQREYRMFCCKLDKTLTKSFLLLS